MEFNVMNIVLYCGIILFATKIFGMGSRKLGLPQVAGMIIAGLLIGPAIFNQLPLGSFRGIMNPTPAEMDVLQSFSQIGVIFILFSSGLETDFKALKQSGIAATAVATVGVLVPVLLGTLGALAFLHGYESFTQPKLMNAMFVGCILAATSVGITVETLRELGKLNTRVGTTILSAAIIDDVLGIIALSLLTGFNGGGNIWLTVLKAVGFFAFTIGGGLILRTLFKRLVRKYPHKRRTSIFALCMCFVYAYCAEKYFGIAAITGAYMAGLMLSGLHDTPFVDRKVIVSGYMFFTPIFFAYIGISADFSQFRWSGLLFAGVFVFLGVIGKIVGCGAIARAFRYSGRESMTIGCGMIARGEVALAVYTAGHSLIMRSVGGQITGIDPLVATICLIIVSSVLCPILLKLCFRGHEVPAEQTGSRQVNIATEALENIRDEEVNS